MFNNMVVQVETINVAATQRELLFLAQQLDGENTANPDPLAKRLRELGKALAGGPSADAWAMIDVYRLIEPMLVVERFNHQQAQAYQSVQLQRVRNILFIFLLFLLLVFTWAGFYGYLGQPGLEIGRLSVSPGLCISDASLTFLLLLLLIVANWFRRRWSRKQTEATEAFRVRLAQTLGDAALYLATGRSQAPTNLVRRFDVVAHQLLSELHEERQRLAELAQRREKEFADLEAFSRGVAGVTSGMQNAANELHHTTVYLVESLHAFSAQYKDIPQQQLALLRTIENAVQQLQQSISILGAIEGRQTHQEHTLTSALSLLGNAITSIVGSASALHSHLNEFNTQQQTFFQNLQVEREVQNKMVLRMINSTKSIEKTLQELDQGANSLHIMAVDLNNMRNQLVTFLKSMEAEIFRDMKETARQISQSSVSLTNAATTIEHAGQALAKTIPSLKAGKDSGSGG